ncbi:MAG: hypothetical protein ACRENJ_01895 [Candidatus Eiseniibacteriota bacterium]
MAADGSGGLYLAWWSDYAVFAQRITAAGEIAPGWPEGAMFLATAGTPSSWTTVDPDGAGGAIVAWADKGIGNIVLQRITAGGALPAGWSPGGVTVSPTPIGYATMALAPDGAGGAIVAWAPFAPKDIYAQRIAADGTRAAGWPAGGVVVCGDPAVQLSPTIAADGEGGAFIAWADGRNQPATGNDIYVQRITAAGTVAPGWPAGGLRICAAAGDQGPTGNLLEGVRLVADGLGGAVVAWPDRRSDPNGDLYAQRVTGAGAVAPGWPADGAVVCDTPNEQQLLPAGAMVPDGAGGVIVCWGDARQPVANGFDVYVQRLMADGSPAPGWPEDGLGLCTAAGNQTYPWAVTNGAGGAIVCWGDGRAGVGNGDIYAALVNADGTTPVLLALVSAEARAGLVLLHWYAADAVGLDAVVHRRTAGTEWAARARVGADGTGHLRFEDRQVVPGARYGYRLGITENGVESFSGEVWVTVPAAAGFAIGAWNAADGSLRVSFSLPADGPATLELFDPGGRRLAARSLDGFGEGSHQLALSRETTPRAGVYLLRLRQGALQASAKAIVLP